MKLFFKSVITAMLVFATTTSFAQPGNNNFIPELIFQNPVLVSGVDGQDGAVYKFSDVAKDIDATVTVVGRSSAAVVLTNIDVDNTGWTKAFQPQLGIPGVVPVNATWWMDFEIRFYKAGTNNKKKVQGFKVTAIDVDGDGGSVQEFLQMNKIKSVAYSPVNYLVEGVCSNLLTDLLGLDNDEKKGTDKMVLGPVQNFTNIDTSGTGVMSTFTYEDKDMISFRYGAKSGAAFSNAGERLNSLWFKAFSLAPPSTLPVKLTSFNASISNKNVNLSWSSATEENFSHYVIERSTDGKNYSDLALVFALPNTGANSNYQYKDANVASSTGVVYYRLRMVDQTKEASYSSIRVIKLNREENTVQLATYPNPVADQLKVTLPSAWQGKSVQLELYTADGTRLQSRQLSNASQTETIKMSSLARGFYLVKASCDGETAQQRVIKD